MTEPEHALDLARRRVADARAQGGYPGDTQAAVPEVPDEISLEQLLDWAVLDQGAVEIRSTRRLGAPITAGKRLLVKALYQYHTEMIAQQQRVNVQLAFAVDQLRRRVAELEARDR